MSYSSQALLANDADFLQRISASAAVEVPHTHQPQTWANENIWWIAAAPGFADAYEYAINTDVERPGNDPAVITDAQILAAVQHLVEEQFAPPPVEEQVPIP
jgi:hypothetical protein